MLPGNPPPSPSPWGQSTLLAGCCSINPIPRANSPTCISSLKNGASGSDSAEPPGCPHGAGTDPLQNPARCRMEPEPLGPAADTGLAYSEIKLKHHPKLPPASYPSPKSQEHNDFAPTKVGTEPKHCRG